MALYPRDFSTQDRLSPGAHGEKFVVDLPGYRDGDERINRTNNNLNVSQHDVPNIKYDCDDRLPALFRYGFAYGNNQIIVPKGRIAAIDGNMDLIDWEDKKQYNTATLANGGVPVRLRTVADKYPADDAAKVKSKLYSTDAKGHIAGQEYLVANVNKEWTPVAGLDKAYAEDSYRPFVDNTATVAEGTQAKFVSDLQQLDAGGYKLDVATDLSDTSFHTGRVADKTTGAVVSNVRDGNIPVGMFGRNEFSRDLDAYNGMAVGPILTDAMVELPWFAYKDKAENNVWGSAYGPFVAGDLLKSDENGRFVKSPLSSDKALATMSISEYEKERQQVIGQVYAVNVNMVPAGAAKWATWALDDRLNYEGFNPEEYKKTNRKGEDNIARSPHNSTGEYPGYPYEKAYNDHDLHMLASNRADNYDERMNQEYQYSELGIPGLTDGYNAVVREFPAENGGTFRLRDPKVPYTDEAVRLLNVNVDKGSVKIAIVPTGTTPEDADFKDAVEGTKYAIKGGTDQVLALTYLNELQGILVFGAADAKKLDAELGKVDGKAVDIYAKYTKRGEAGVPTFMDWDGCIGSVKILLTK